MPFPPPSIMAAAPPAARHGGRAALHPALNRLTPQQLTPDQLTPDQLKPSWRSLARLALVSCLLLLSLGRPAAAQSPSMGAAFGDTLAYRGCLKFTAVTYSDRQDSVDNHDWVTMRVRNECRAPLRNLLVELNLIDFQGNVYSDQVWLLDRTRMLLPRMSRLERYAIPDPDQRVAVRWGVRILNLETDRRRVPVRRTTRKAPEAPFCILGICL